MSHQEKEALLRRHKLERKEQRKAANDMLTGTKGEERAAAEAKIKTIQEELIAKHAAEMERFEKGEPIDSDATGTENQLQNLALGENDSEPTAASPATPSEGKPMNKAQRRREKKKQEEAQRRKEIEDAKQGLGPSEREVETDALNSILKPLGYKVKEVKADGHCMFRALGDQLLQTGLGTGLFDGNEGLFYKRIRDICANSIMERSAQFEPFIELGEESGCGTIEDYCDKIRNTSEWGGQIELQAFAHALQVPVMVYSATAPEVVIGEEYFETIQDLEPLRVTYHKYYYALGEHYNSVQPVASEGPDEAGFQTA